MRRNHSGADTLRQPTRKSGTKRPVALILRAESAAYSSVFRNLTHFLAGLSVLNRAVGRVSLGVAQGWYLGGPLVLKSGIAQLLVWLVSGFGAI